MRYLLSILAVVAAMAAMIAIMPTSALAETTPSGSSWNSLEVAKLVASGIAPLIVAFVGVLIGYLVNKRLRQDEQEIERQREEQEELKQKSYLYVELRNRLKSFIGGPTASP